jgi:hypothetical protein
MSEVVNELAGLEKQLRDSKQLVERRQMALRLSENPDFRKLILEGFCLHDAARYVQESADPFLGVHERADALNMAQASGHLKRFLSVSVQMGAHAERTLPELEEAIEEARSLEGAA